MTDEYQQKLEQAFDLIREERFEDAQLVLQPIILSRPDADAWWLWANAVSEPEDARHALSKVLEIDPNHAQAREFMTGLESVYPAMPEAISDRFEFGMKDDFDDMVGDSAGLVSLEQDIPAVVPPEQAPRPDAYDVEQPVIRQIDSSSELDDGSDVVDFSDWLEDLAEAEDVQSDQDDTSIGGAAASMSEPSPSVQPSGRRNALRSILVVSLVLLVGLAAAILLLDIGGSAPVPVADAPVWTTLSEPSDLLQSVLEAAQQGSRPASLGGPVEARLATYEDGATLLFQVCRGAGSDLPEALEAGMEQVARYGISAQDELAYVAVSLINCERQDTLTEALAPIEEAVAFASGRLDAEAFQLTWVVNP